MKITIFNPINKKAIHFLDQKEIDIAYGPEKITLDTNDFINDRNLNLYSDGGDGGLYALPQNSIESYNRNFTQKKIYLSNTYNIRTIELVSSLPANIVEFDRSVANIINDVVGHDQYTLKMLVDGRNDGGNLLEIAEVGCKKSPLTSNEFKFEFEVYGDSVNSFLGPPKIITLSPITSGGELKYSKKYPIRYDEGTVQIKDIINTGDVAFEPIITFIGEGTTPRVTNLTTGDYAGYKGVMVQNDVVIINSKNRTLKKNSVSDLANLLGTFLILEPGNNLLKFTCTQYNGANPMKCIIEYRPVFSGV